MARIALVFGIWDYPGKKALPNARLDAENVVKSLEQRGFDCTLVTDGRGDVIMSALDQFKKRCKGADLALIFYAGHGLEHRGMGFILPTDTPPLTVGVLRTFGVAIPDLIESMNMARARVLVLDACREEVLDPQLQSVVNELRSSEQDWDNVLIAYSTSAGDEALDGADGAGSRFCNAFCATLLRHDLSIEDCFREIGATVMRQTSRGQRPWNYSSLNERVAFSDLTPFELVQTHPTGLEGRTGPFSMTRGGKGQVIAFGGPVSVWQATLQSVSALKAGGGDVVCGLAKLPGNRLAILEENGTLQIASSHAHCVFDTGIEGAFGLRASPSGKTLAIIGTGVVILLRSTDTEITKFFEAEHAWDAYGATFISEDRAWFCGDHGRILDVTWANGAPSAQISRSIEGHLNAMVHTPAGVYLAGHGGRIWRLAANDPGASPNLVAQLSSRVETPLARRGSLLSVASDKEIANFLFSPEKLSAQAQHRLETELESNRLMWVDHAPTRPILVVSNNEGLIYVIDSRDGQLVQTINASAGRDHEIQGLCFLNDRHFAALGKDGAIRFYACG